MTELLTPREMRLSWDNLSGAERQALRDRCALTTAEGADATVVDEETTASIDASPAGEPVTMAQLCEEVNAWGPDQ
ncbi:hypothetical protein [Mesorhizobium sp. CAU 1741]|uniref:hypothetical protein n=1 Tax=Mesorhizobium sp. CAU 1741 TaxID=3140366 RepID=UPI00325B9500